VIRLLLLYLSGAGWAKATVTGWRFAKRAARRFVAGETLQEAVAVARSLAEHGLTSSLAHLGEDVTDQLQANRAADSIVQIAREIGTQSLSSNLSLKLTQIGLMVDFGLCKSNMLRIAREAAIHDVFVRIDMEDSTKIDQTLSLHQYLRNQGVWNVGLVFQSVLHRSAQDTRMAADASIPVRVVKGAYLEPRSVAYQSKAEVDANFDRLTDIVIRAAAEQGGAPAAASGRTPPVTAIASHDERRIAYAEAAAIRLGLPKAALEFQLLLGIRSEMQRSLREGGYPVRIYVPFGTEWYPYLVRRLAERPANLWFFLSNFLRR
jgi:proline dehydrogenase